jgi:hypothetical protein
MSAIKLEEVRPDIETELARRVRETLGALGADTLRGILEVLVLREISERLAAIQPLDARLKVLEEEWRRLGEGILKMREEDRQREGENLTK